MMTILKIENDSSSMRDFQKYSNIYQKSKQNNSEQEMLLIVPEEIFHFPVMKRNKVEIST